MSITIQEGNLSFIFQCLAIKFDDTSYYRDHFIKIQKGTKSVDILAVDNNIGYLIEIKDYTHPNTKKLEPLDLIEAIVNKVVSTLSAILPMKNNANNQAEKDIAKLFANTDEIKVFLHIELSPPTSKIKQSTWNLPNIQMKLKNRLKPIDAHPKVVSKKYPDRLSWTVI